VIAIFVAFLVFIVTILPGVGFSILGFSVLKKRSSFKNLGFYIRGIGFLVMGVYWLLHIFSLKAPTPPGGAPTVEDWEYLFKMLRRWAALPGLASFSGGLVQLIVSIFIKKPQKEIDS
nr:hypothetical protein [Spirochaetaceae bacterium]